ncbi:LacI family DNA-binding transcriptional regulator [Limosilactobacillus sp. STM2_1]|uniref:LacI family DNA-binding transcriptional regulator n=1 Tax=Limosilactobacillus rudii TaxID=2759755 RepID=A0A7W3UKM6_9LACO|nr:LacI family DNA-binding transcriptional regulator [Limosilactobacillus rudii]MBB1079238.1 LacI family DNA-binding transcriptional regulator [Limosilactobacillus rudii]MBB1097327.1 LacI family DNA-binding transcriptional regulator [Limosilactobacillus rudii]MCD7134436.1 LacI family DNA-binding transcriptional regulator [Limosilactobacillus rudii]
MVTIYDVAKRVGCAPSTISKYITKHGYVSQQLGQRIALAIQELDYHYNGMARSLSTNTNNRIGIMVPFLNHPYFQGLVSAISEAATAVNKEVIIFPTKYDINREKHYLAELEHQLISGLIITSHALPYQEIAQYKRFGEIVFCETLADESVKSVNINRYSAFIDLFKTLKKNVKSNIGFLLIRPAKQSITTRDTLKAYQEVFHSPIPSNSIQYHCCTAPDGQKAVAKIIKKNPQLQVLLTEGDASAAGAFKYLQKIKHDHIMIIGQGNRLPSQLLNFSSIDQHITQIGQKAVALVLDHSARKKEDVSFNIIWRK